ncbi:glycogen debranching protein GlgX [Tianweitania sediminis]|uniref:Glycogen debranching protein GlgX n=1 Tax=Tianweitania sediminis TaxID=1502156 RepID=A0A8J7R1E7_9HYPH|nr:glycogen debranching protein GlgX [Tianweitania sediminis]MBP0438838.1 glycogen debranching protein GlgX [Tianweitania sediminis]
MSTRHAQLGAKPDASGTHFAVWSSAAERIWVSLFDATGERETARHELSRGAHEVFALHLPGVSEGARYGFRAEGAYEPDRGLWFDPNKLLTDPYALTLDRPFTYDPRLGAPREAAIDTAPLMPKCVVTRLPAALPAQPPLFQPGGLIYELNVRAFTMRHPGVAKDKQGTIAALAEPVVIEYLQKLGVSAVELMPITAWIDERHLPTLGLRNAWGYNPVNYLALDPRLAPGGQSELRDAVAALKRAGIGTILDVVFNHTGESDQWGPTLSLRGLDARSYFRHAPDGTLVNDTGTGNTLACDHPAAQHLILDALRHFVLQSGIEGFRFDLAPILGRDKNGFSAKSALLQSLRSDPVVGSRTLIAEPWDIGAGGYQLGNFRAPFLEWNDRYRDDVRRFWRGDGGLGALATRLAGSSDIFGRSGEDETRSINFLASHDGMALADVTAYCEKHNAANGEDNRDGHNENLSWNHGVEGPSGNAAVLRARRADLKAMLGTLFASVGTIMLTAGDEFGRTQKGNNNAYAQDNDTTWLDWESADADLLGHASALSQLRKRHPVLGHARLLTSKDVQWLSPTGEALSALEWEEPDSRKLAMVLTCEGERLAVLVNGGHRASLFRLPEVSGVRWRTLDGECREDHLVESPPRSVVFAIEEPVGELLNEDRP